MQLQSQELSVQGTVPSQALWLKSFQQDAVQFCRQERGHHLEAACRATHFLFEVPILYLSAFACIFRSVLLLQAVMYIRTAVILVQL